jgi:quinohemoprotein amine dehydrogenase beta subunit
MRTPILGALAALALAPSALARDLLVTVARPGNLYVFDAAERALLKDCALGLDPTPGVVAMAPDGATAFVLVNHWQDVIGVDVASCEIVFHAVQSEGDVTRRSLASLAVSKDGTRVYTIRNPVRRHADRLEPLEPEFAVFDAAAGLDAQPLAVHAAPRRSTVMATGADGTVYVGGHDIDAVDPETGVFTTAIPNANWDRPTYGAPDVLAFWPIGSQNDEFLLLYSAPVFADETKAEMTDFVWGFSSVDLETGTTEIRDFTSFEVIMFSAVRNPVAPNELYGVYTQLSKHDVDTGELVKRVDLPHTYYVINVSTDGREVYVGGTSDDIGVYDTATLERIGEMRIPSGGDMSVSTVQVVRVE